MNPILITLGVIFMTLGAINFYYLIVAHVKETGGLDISDLFQSAIFINDKPYPYGLILLLSAFVVFVGAVLLELGL